MAMPIDPKLIDVLLMGVGGRRRELQDFPVLGDVWAAFAAAPGKPQDLLITPTWERPTGDVARLIARREEGDCDTSPPADRKVAYLHGLVVAELTLADIVGIALPATKWWDVINDRWEEDYLDAYKEPDEERHPSAATLYKWIGWELAATLREERMSGRLADEERPESAYDEMDMEDRQAARLGLLLGVLQAAAEREEPSKEELEAAREKSGGGPLAALDALFGRETILATGTKAVRQVIRGHRSFEAGQVRVDDADPIDAKGFIFQISLNRAAQPAITESVGAVKADAARALFSISCKEIGWAVLDSGIDHTHRAFWDYERIFKDQQAGKPPASPRPHRIRATYDFRRIRAIMSVDGIEHESLVGEIQERTSLKPAEIRQKLKEIAELRSEGKRVDWARVVPLILHDRPDPPPHPHGTHVAGIIGAHWLDFSPAKTAEPQPTDKVKMTGLCPDIQLYDFRVLGSTLGDSEFAVIAALQFIRYLNDQSGYSVIHGVNMSLSIPHNVRNYACGRTPVCVEAEALTSNDVVVVAAAGNRGFQQYKLADDSLFDGYAASSITDPGNADGVITVGATHRAWPHTYGVSFFSSRGPTGDGRMKPDLLAPGEKITSCIPGGNCNRSDQMDGTSMAAPHVSGAAALLMARHQELIGQPARVKQILCDTATDLKRERSFQGHGMVDVLRAIQSI